MAQQKFNYTHYEEKSSKAKYQNRKEIRKHEAIRRARRHSPRN